MSFIPKNTTKITNTVLTDIGRKFLSEGRFNIKYFQIGDSEVSYSFSGITIENGAVLSPEFNAHNRSFNLGSNKSSVKYPVLMDEKSTYGLPFNVSNIISAFKHVESKGFFEENSGVWDLNLNYGWVVNGNFSINTNLISGGTTIVPVSAFCVSLTVEEDGCCPPQTATTTTTTTTIFDPCDYTGATQTDNCVLEDFSRDIGEIKEGDFMMLILNCGEDCNSLGILKNNIFTYRICCILNGNKFVLDRELPHFEMMGITSARIVFYSSDFRRFYDSFTPEYYWKDKTLNFETSCDLPKHHPLVWNMSIPWTESPAGVMENKYKSFKEYNSFKYSGTKNYLGYSFLDEDLISREALSLLTGVTGSNYFNSLGERVYVSPNDQKAIAIIHYTNNGVDFEYGEKLALEGDNGPNFKLTIPWLLWHQNTGNTIGESFYVDPPNFTGLNKTYFYERGGKAIESLYYHKLWGNSSSTLLKPNEIGKVFPSHKMIVIDDEEIVAALSPKSNRNWTLPAPSVRAVNVNICAQTPLVTPLITNSDWVWVTYLFENYGNPTNSLHCNYYAVIKPKLDCVDINMNIEMKFKYGFGFLSTTFGCGGGYYATGISFLVQKTKENERPDPAKWRKIDLSDQIPTNTIESGFISQASLTGTTFSIDEELYKEGEEYNLNAVISLPEKNSDGKCLNFGDETFFYGNIETDVRSDVYEMKYILNLVDEQFITSTNPTWSPGQSIYLTEIGLLDDKDNILLTSKLASPKKREGIQQISVSFIV